MNREIKFRVIYKGKIHGFEKLTNLGWFWDCIDLDPDNGQERWVRGVFPYGFEYLRNQYTGLKDKNGVETYEGDIFSRKQDNELFVLEWIDHEARFGLTCISDGEPIYVEYVNEMQKEGNIYQHPELLKK